MSDVITFNTEDTLKQVEVKEIATFNLVAPNDPILYEPVVPFDFANPIMNPNELASTLVETCKKLNGVGLAANQCGIKTAVFVMGLDNEYVAFFNPRILGGDNGSIIQKEGCLSFPGLEVSVCRPFMVSVEYFDFTGERHEQTFTGFTARQFCHEFDHLNGTTMLDRAKPLARKMALDRWNKKRKAHIKAQKLMMEQFSKLKA